MNDTPASGDRIQKYIFNFEIYRFAKKRPIYPILSTWYGIGTAVYDHIYGYHYM